MTVKDKSVAVVIPAHNEERLIAQVVETLPDFVDAIYVVNDGSTDRTSEVVRACQAIHGGRLHLVEHPRNFGVGAAIATGYIRASEDGIDVVAVMGGDAQMNPAELLDIVRPVAEGRVDYTKGNRFGYPDGWRRIPKVRMMGNATLSFLTRVASGYWHLWDSQTGYTAISRDAINAIDARKIYPGYGCPNDILIRLNAAGRTVEEVPVEPVYNVGEVSGLRVRRVLFTISTLLARGFVWRVWTKYLRPGPHPVGLLYSAGAALSLTGLGLIVRRVFQSASAGERPRRGGRGRMAFAIGAWAIAAAAWLESRSTHLPR